MVKVEEGKFTGRVLQRELSLITNLMTTENFENVTKDDGSPLNVTRAKLWFEVEFLWLFRETVAESTEVKTAVK